MAVCCFKSKAKEKGSAGSLAKKNDGAKEAVENGMRAAGAAGGNKRDAETEKQHTEAEGGGTGDASVKHLSLRMQERHQRKTKGRGNSKKCRDSLTHTSLTMGAAIKVSAEEGVMAQTRGAASDTPAHNAFRRRLREELDARSNFPCKPPAKAAAAAAAAAPVGRTAPRFGQEPKKWLF